MVTERARKKPALAGDSPKRVFVRPFSDEFNPKVSFLLSECESRCPQIQQDSHLYLPYSKNP